MVPLAGRHEAAGRAHRRAVGRQAQAASAGGGNGPRFSPVADAQLGAVGRRVHPPFHGQARCFARIGRTLRGDGGRRRVQAQAVLAVGVAHGERALHGFRPAALFVRCRERHVVNARVQRPQGGLGAFEPQRVAGTAHAPRPAERCVAAPVGERGGFAPQEHHRRQGKVGHGCHVLHRERLRCPPASSAVGRRHAQAHLVGARRGIGCGGQHRAGRRFLAARQRPFVAPARQRMERCKGDALARGTSEANRGKGSVRCGLFHHDGAFRRERPAVGGAGFQADGLPPCFGKAQFGAAHGQLLGPGPRCRPAQGEHVGRAACLGTQGGSGRHRVAGHHYFNVALARIGLHGGSVAGRLVRAIGCKGRVVAAGVVAQHDAAVLSYRVAAVIGQQRGRHARPGIAHVHGAAYLVGRAGRFPHAHLGHVAVDGSVLARAEAEIAKTAHACKALGPQPLHGASVQTDGERVVAYDEGQVLPPARGEEGLRRVQAAACVPAGRERTVGVGMYQEAAPSVADALVPVFQLARFQPEFERCLIVVRTENVGDDEAALPQPQGHGGVRLCAAGTAGLRRGLHLLRAGRC